jgi:two-component system chemotaxis response regulator CheB
MGMLAIKRSGGRTIVQDPNTAEYPDMPLSVLNNMQVDECRPLSEIGATINNFAEAEDVPSVEVPDDIKLEAEISEKVLIGIDIVSSLGESTVYSCPSCGGGLWKVEKNGVDHYRCHIGHSFSEKGLNMKQSETLEATLWVAVRIMEERRKLLKNMEEDTNRRGFKRMADEHRLKRREMDGHIDRLKDLLFAVQRTDVEDTAPNL